MLRTTLSATLFLLIPAASFAQDDGTIRDYLEMRAFAEGLYNQLDGAGNNVRQSDFKRLVDAAVEKEREDDKNRAFEVNTSASSKLVYVGEDRYRVYTGLYESPVVQALVNRIGQSVVTGKVSQLYTFKLIADPLPRAECLSTGTVYITTGLVALMKSKAELAFVLAHEAAHVYLEHHRTRTLLELAQVEYNRLLEENGDATRTRAGRFAALAGAATSVVTGNNTLAGIAAGATNSLMSRGAAEARSGAIQWNRFEEEEADRLAMDWLLDSAADIEQIPQVFSKVRDLGGRDPNVAMGFLGQSDRIRERLVSVQARLAEEKLRPEFANRQIEGSDPDFTAVLADVQRDNGVAAFHYDMLETARTNLEAAVQVKTQDPTVLYFYAKILLQTAQTEEERNRADEYFKRAADYDYRNQNYGTYLHRAVRMMTKANATDTDKKQAVALLQEYVLRYLLSKSDDSSDTALDSPPHLDAVYDYMARAGELKWRVDEEKVENARKQRDAGATSYADFVTQGTATKQSTAAPRPEPEPPAAEAPKPEPPKAAPAKNNSKAKANTKGK